jgi:hypothetical protein
VVVIQLILKGLLVLLSLLLPVFGTSSSAAVPELLQLDRTVPELLQLLKSTRRNLHQPLDQETER